MTALLALLVIGQLCSNEAPYAAQRCQKFYVECVRIDPRNTDEAVKITDCILKRLPAAK